MLSELSALQRVDYLKFTFSSGRQTMTHSGNLTEAEASDRIYGVDIGCMAGIPFLCESKKEEEARALYESGVELEWSYEALGHVALIWFCP
ncbi:hypothetical protein KCP73_23775 [Salmonella enterica subsp. enterica]|nr:hypothetical protein KCP73_23775 [Salmonella enterica subsp. enterica]